MDLSIGNIMKCLEDAGFSCDYRGRKDVSVSGFSDPGSYRTGTAIWLGDVKYLRLPEGKTTHDVALLFARRDMEGVEDFDAVLYSDDPRDAFMKLVETAYPRSVRRGVEADAAVSEYAKLGEGVYVGHGAVVEDGAEIGARTQIGHRAVIRSGVRIGQDCVVGDGSALGNEGFGFRRDEGGELYRLPHIGGVIVGDRVEIGSNVVIDKGTFRDTVVCDGAKIDSLCMIGHNCTIGENVSIVRSLICGNVVIGRSCEIVGAEVKNRVVIGDETKVGIGSVVIGDLPPRVSCFGNPGRIIKK